MQTIVDFPEGALIQKTAGKEYVYFPNYFYDKNAPRNKTSCRLGQHTV